MTPPGALLTPEQRRERLAQAVAQAVGDGWRVESQSDYAVTLVKGEKVNHILHFLVSVFTCGAWALVWMGLAASGGERRSAFVAPEYEGSVVAADKTIGDMSTRELLDDIVAALRLWLNRTRAQLKAMTRQQKKILGISIAVVVLLATAVAIVVMWPS